MASSCVDFHFMCVVMMCTCAVLSTPLSLAAVINFGCGLASNLFAVKTYIIGAILIVIDHCNISFKSALHG